MRVVKFGITRFVAGTMNGIGRAQVMPVPVLVKRLDELGAAPTISPGTAFSDSVPTAGKPEQLVIGIPPGEIWELRIYCSVDKKHLSAKDAGKGSGSHRFSIKVLEEMGWNEPNPDLNEDHYDVLAQPLSFIIETVPDFQRGYVAHGIDTSKAARTLDPAVPAPDFPDSDGPVYPLGRKAGRNFPDADELWGRLSPRYELGHASLFINVPDPMTADTLFAFVSHFTVQRQMWRWNGQPAGKFSFDELVKSIPALAQTGDSITETIHASELSESHAQKLIPARERARAVVATITLDAFAEFVVGKLQNKL